MRDEWHVAISYGGQALKCAEALRDLACVEDVYAPTRVQKSIYRGREVTRLLPWLGSLVLARWDGDDPVAWHDVTDIVGVADILGGWPPANVSNAAVEIFQTQIQNIETNNYVVAQPPCSPGDEVRFSYL